LYDHQLIIMHERSLRSTIVGATRQYEAALARSIHAEIDSECAQALFLSTIQCALLGQLRGSLSEGSTHQQRHRGIRRQPSGERAHG
jgi:hypothetical protein